MAADKTRNILLEFSMAPLGKGESIGAPVAEVIGIVAQSGLDYRRHAMGTVVEGTWDEVFGLVRRCFEQMAQGAGRISCSIKLDDRAGKSGRLDAKVQSVIDTIGDVKVDRGP